MRAKATQKAYNKGANASPRFVKGYLAGKDHSPPYPTRMRSKHCRNNSPPLTDGSYLFLLNAGIKRLDRTTIMD
jgi:hypothetical protein